MFVWCMLSLGQQSDLPDEVVLGGAVAIGGVGAAVAVGLPDLRSAALGPGLGLAQLVVPAEVRRPFQLLLSGEGKALPHGPEDIACPLLAVAAFTSRHTCWPFASRTGSRAPLSG